MRRKLVDQVLALENILTGLGVVALVLVFVPEILGRYAPSPKYAFSVGAALTLVGAYLRNRARKRE
jgi:hypothetical protein